MSFVPGVYSRAILEWFSHTKNQIIKHTFAHPCNSDFVLAGRDDDNAGTEVHIQAFFDIISALYSAIQGEVSRVTSEGVIDEDGHLHVSAVDIDNRESVGPGVIKNIFDGSGLPVRPRDHCINIPFLQADYGMIALGLNVRLRPRRDIGVIWNQRDFRLPNESQGDDLKKKSDWPHPMINRHHTTGLESVCDQ